MKPTQLRYLTCVLFAGLLSPLFATRASAQARPDEGIDLAVTYAALHTTHTDGVNFWLQGGGFDLNAPFYRGLGLTASATGLHSNGNPATNAAPLDMVTIVFGPRYTARLGRRLAVYGEALGGEAHGFHSLFTYGSGPLPSLTAGTTDSANALAFQTGGGVDLRISKHLKVRAVQVDYLRTELPNGSSNLQNNLRVSAGVVFHLGR